MYRVNDPRIKIANMIASTERKMAKDCKTPQIDARIDALMDVAVLREHMFSFLPDDWRAMARRVSRAWHAANATYEEVDYETILAEGARQGSLALMRDARAQGIDLSVCLPACAAAAAGGQTRALVWLRRRGCAWDTWAPALAARGGHLSTLRWILSGTSGRCGWAPDQVFAEAAGGGHVPVLHWLRRAHGCEWSAAALAAAAGNGHTSVLALAFEDGVAPGADACNAAAERGQLATLQWAADRKCLAREDLCLRAARAGELATLRWARAQGCPWGAWVCSQAAHHGHLAVLRWAVENGCECEVGETYGAAATHGSTVVLQYLVDRGYKLDAAAVKAGAEWAPPETRAAVLDWLDGACA
jgi:hypothetical protein